MITDNIANHLQQYLTCPVFAGGVAPADTNLPYVCIYLISNVVDLLTGFQTIRIQFSVWASDYSTANDLADQIFKIYQGFTGEMDVYLAKLLDRSDLYDPNDNIFGQQLDFQILIRKEDYI